MFNTIPIEKVKKYWNEKPCNLGYSSYPVGSPEYFDEVEAKKYFIEPHIPKFVQFEKWRNKKVLEIGCGIGTDTINFARAGAQVTAVELSDSSLRVAKQRAQVYRLHEKIKFYCGNAQELSKFLPPEQYDLIYSFGVIHHTSHPEKVIEEIKKYSKPGTIVKIMVYHRYSWPVFWMLLKGKGAFWKLDELVAKYSESQDCPIVYTYSKKSAKKLLKGFTLIDFSTELPLTQSNTFLKLSERFYFFKVLKPLLEAISKPFGWHLCFTAKL